jgi:hypothetical protein
LSPIFSVLRGVGGAVRRAVDVARRAAVAAPAAGAADHRAELVVREDLAGLVGGLDRDDDEGVLALVEDVLDPGAVAELGLRRERAAQLGVLFAVQQAVEAVVEAGGVLAVAERIHHAGEGGDDGVGREGGEALAVHLVDVAQVASSSGSAAAPTPSA